MYLDHQSSDVDSDGSADDSGHTKAAAQSGSYIVPPSDSSPSQLMLIEEVNRVSCIPDIVSTTVHVAVPFFLNPQDTLLDLVAQKSDS